MGCLTCSMFFCEESEEWKLKVAREIDVENDNPGYKVLGGERVVMEVGGETILGHGDIIYPGSLEDSYRINMTPPLTNVKPWKPRRVSSTFLDEPIYRFL